jgi:hypothetical protein
MSRSYRDDLLALALLIALSLTVHRHALGFYGDDWWVLRAFAFSEDQSLPGLFRAMYAWPHVRMRPGQVLYTAGLYRLFGLHPLGYHLVNAAVLVAVGLLLYVVLRRLGLHRSLSVAVALLYSVLPHYSTDRVWYAACQVPLSVAFYLVSLYAALGALRGERWRSAGWQALSASSLLASGLCYELTIPLFLLHPILVGWAARVRGLAADPHLESGSGSRRLVRRRWLTGTVVTLVALTALLAYKSLTTTRLAHDLSGGHVRALARKLVRIDVWDYGLAAPHALSLAFRSSTPWALIVAAALAIATVWYLHRIAAESEEKRSTVREALSCIAWGIVVVPLGLAIIAAGGVGLTAAGRANRVAMVSAAGLALVIVGAVAGATAWMTPRIRRRWFSGIMAATAAGAFIINAQHIAWWGAAYRTQRETLAALRAAFPTLPHHTAIILDGACHDAGAGIVFYSQYDLRGALALQYGDSTLRADVVLPTLAVRGDGLHTFKYGEDNKYAYGRLVVFNLPSRTVHRPADSAAAWSYFARFNPDRKEGPCPSSPETLRQ